jgi:hypothetical protein
MSKAGELLSGALLILIVAPVALLAVGSMGPSGIGIQLPYVFWVVLYIVYAFGILAKG